MMKRRAFLMQTFSAAAALAVSGCAAPLVTAPEIRVGRGSVPVPALQPHGVIGVIAPAGPAAGAADQIIAWLEARGYGTHLYPGTEEASDYLAGSDVRRLQDLHDAFSNQRIDAIICLRGGYGSARLLDRIDFDLIRAHPKPFVGYSDITALHLAFARYVGFVTFHGPMLTSDLLRSKEEPTATALFDMLQGRLSSGTLLEHPESYPLTTLTPGVAHGKLTGGNLSMIASTLGTPYEIETRESILFIEDVGEPLYRIDRLLTQLRLAGKYDGVRGVLVGDFDILTLNDVAPLLKQEFGPLNIPILADWRSGHSNPNLTLPLGAIVTLDASRQQIRLEQAVVQVHQI